MQSQSRQLTLTSLQISNGQYIKYVDFFFNIHLYIRYTVKLHYLNFDLVHKKSLSTCFTGVIKCKEKVSTTSSSLWSINGIDLIVYLTWDTFCYLCCVTYIIYKTCKKMIKYVIINNYQHIISSLLSVFLLCLSLSLLTHWLGPFNERPCVGNTPLRHIGDFFAYFPAHYWIKSCEANKKFILLAIGMIINIFKQGKGTGIKVKLLIIYNTSPRAVPLSDHTIKIYMYSTIQLESTCTWICQYSLWTPVSNNTFMI